MLRVVPLSHDGGSVGAATHVLTGYQKAAETGQEEQRGEGDAAEKRGAGRKLAPRFPVLLVHDFHRHSVIKAE
jgi:hypothetical protein